MTVKIEASSLDKNFRRTIPKPIDASSVWETYANASEYAANNGTDDYCPYAGQLVVTLQGYPDVDANSEKYKSAHVWRLAAGGQDTIVGGLTRKHFVLEEVKTGGEVAGTTVHNTFTGGTQTFAAWIEMLQGMTMGYTLATETDGNGETHVKTDPTTGMPKVKYINGQGQIQERVMNADDERVWVDDEGKGHMVISAIKVLGTLEVTQIDVNHITHSGGLFVNSRANIIVDEVEQLSGGRTKLTFVGTANGQTLFNLFEVGDLALSMTFNVLKEGASTPSEGKVVRVYWREVTAVDDTSITLKAGTSDMATPRKGDTVVHLGHIDAPSGSSASAITHAKSRQGCQVMGFSDTYGPYFAEYDGINAPSASVNFDRPNNAIVYLSPNYHKLQGESILLKQGDNYIQLAETLTTMASNITTNATNIQTNARNIQTNAQTITTVANDVSVTAEEIRLEANNYTNLITNGKFEPNSSSVTGNYLPNGWTRYGSSYVYANQDNKTHGGVIVKTSGYGDSYYIQQSIIWSSVLSAGNMHTLSFWYKGSKVRVNLNGLSSYLPAKIIVNSNEVTHSGGQVEIATDSSKFTRQVIKFFVKGSFTGTVSGYLRFTAREGIGEIAMPQLNIGNVTSLDITAGKMLAVTDTYEIQNNKGETTFTIDEDGNIVGEGDASFKGIVKASGGEFTGKVTATSGKIGGVTINSDGSLEAESGASFKGDIYASGGTIGNLQVSSLSNTINSKTDQTVFEQGMNRIHMGVTNKVRNYVTNPRAIDGTKGTTSTDPYVATDPEYGSVEAIYSTSGGDWQWWHTIDNKYNDLTGGNVTWFCIVKPVNAASGWRINFGSGYQTSAPTSHAAVCVRYDTTTGKVNCTTELDASNYGNNIKTEAVPLANGWYLCYTSAKLKSGVTIIPGQNCVGYNSTYGRWHLYCCGIVKGEGYPSVNLLMEDTNLRDTGIDIEDKKITAKADNFVVQNSSGTKTFEIGPDGNIYGRNDAKFEGKVIATSGEFTGKITASSGSIGPIEINSNGLGVEDSTNLYTVIHKGSVVAGKKSVAEVYIDSDPSNSWRKGAVIYAENKGNGDLTLIKAVRGSIDATLSQNGQFSVAPYSSSTTGTSINLSAGNIFLSGILNIKNVLVSSDTTIHLNGTNYTLVLCTGTSGQSIYLPNGGLHGQVIMVKRAATGTSQIRVFKYGASSYYVSASGYSLYTFVCVNTTGASSNGVWY